jgi:hypothetical protein
VENQTKFETCNYVREKLTLVLSLAVDWTLVDETLGKTPACHIDILGCFGETKNRSNNL